MTPGIELAVDARCELGECPVWNDAGAELLWTDAPAQRIHAWQPATGDRRVIDLPRPIGSFALRVGEGLILAMADGFWMLSDGRIRPLSLLETASERMNDGKCDAAGRFWAGSASQVNEPVGALYRMDGHGLTRVIDGIGMSNGLGWSPDGRTLYFVDTKTQRIDAFAFEPSTGALSDREPFVHVPRSAGLPDGLTVDAEGSVWLAIWGGGAVHRYDSTGALRQVIRLPVSKPSSCTFGGPALDELFITSARTNLSADTLAREPNAGGVFRYRPGVIGLPAARFAG